MSPQTPPVAFNLQIISADGLPLRRFSKLPNVHVKAAIEGYNLQSKTQPHTSSPVWNETFHFKACETSSLLSLELFHDSKFHKNALLCASEIAIDVELDLHVAANPAPQGRIKTSLSLVSNGSLIASNAQQLALELVRRGNPVAGGYVDGIFSISLQTPPVVIDQPIKDVLDKLNLFMRIADEAAKVHPYAKFAWDLLSAAHKIIMAQLAIDQSIVDLANTMQEVYSFVDAIEAVPSKITQLEDIIQRIFVQTVECTIFIREYSGHGFAGRILRETMGASTSAKVTGMAQNLITLRSQFDTGIAVQTVIFCFRIQEDVTAIRECAKRNAVKNQTLTLLGSCGVALSSCSGCLPGTRHDVICEVLDWAAQPAISGQSNILWLYGMAGTGKSTVAVSVARYFAEIERLGAFIRFDEELPGSDPSTAVKALAHQLALYDGRLAASIVQAINRDARILDRSASMQFDKLIIEPLESIPELHSGGPIIVVVDGLDQRGRSKELESLLDILARRAKTLPTNLRFIITSRQGMTSADYPMKSREITITSERDYLDIATYFQFRMRQVRDKNEDLPADWPGVTSVMDLVGRARGFFPWAVAASKFIDAHDPPERLRLLLDDNPISEVNALLDKIYAETLDSVGDWTDGDFVADFRSTMSAISASPIPLSITGIGASLNSPLRRPLMKTIRQLGALMTIHTPVVQVLHPSFFEFLTSREPRGCGIFGFQPRPDMYSTLPAIQNLLQCMCSGLKRNMCNTTIAAPIDTEVLPEDLACACESWVDYICAIDAHQLWGIVALGLFLRTHLLHWFEAMSRLKKTKNISPMLGRVVAWLAENGSEDKSLKMLVIDAIEFARNFAADIAEHPLYVYYAALPLHPPDSILYQTFHDSRIDPSVCVLRDHLDIAYSLDGRQYAAWDAIEEHEDIRVKETATGQELLKIANNGKLRYVNSVAFSYDGSRIAAGGPSCVYVWDSVAGAEAIGPLSHSTSNDWVRAVAWSTNGERLVSASTQGEMILWDTASAEGNRLSTTRLPDSPWIVSVAFSSDGSQIASCSYNGSIFVWDPLDGSIFLVQRNGESLLVKWAEGTQARDLSTSALLPLPDSLAGAVGLSRGGFMVDLLHRRIRKDMRWEDDEYLEWGTHGEYFAFRTGGELNAERRREWQHHVVLLPKGV
ncbi:hypothetical protein HWV62_229 [Athelia sp. TMB]|nr:hypothetical protein HWV62_229 [Athelia sp. TMB]